MILNLTQHPASPEQIACGVVDLPASERAALTQLLTVNALPSKADVLNRCQGIAMLAVHNGLGGDDGCDPHPVQAMIAGASWMISCLEGSLLDEGIEPVHAFSVRESQETTLADGSVMKMAVFKHVGFV